MTHSRPAPPEGQWALKIAPIPGMSKVLDQEDGGIVMQWVHDQVWQPCGNNDCPGIPKSPVHFAPDLADEVRRIMKCEGRLWRIEADAEWQDDRWVARAILPQDPERAKYPRQAMVYVFAVHGDYEPFRTRLGLAERYMAASDYILGEAIPDGYGFAANIQKDAEGVPRMIIGHRITMHVPRNEPEGTKERPRGEDALKPLMELRVAGTLVHHCMYGPVDHEPHEDEEDADLDDDGLLYDEDDIPGD